MRCRNCDYPLWNLKARECPECGASFRPSEFEFVAQSVRFCCPHCDQEYFGTDERGHLRPVEFNCTKCATRVEMDAMVLRPADTQNDSSTKLGEVPWI